ncbi:hypothetical protein JCM21714_3577 [Gracilibacillus boraciitolerans JCM 21714]|uniref:PFL family protein n=1 Tax=Gracilibacillus boraciitolerans JCM 21714 TaxID=1298598 RepID=W4VMS0_9BACI|nr:hypothetical protein JCM21714_3577 [Gracilibacillus boraciitolerans JCM 21714]
MPIGFTEIQETIRMVEMEHLDIRTVTMGGISLQDCADHDFEKVKENVYQKITSYAKDLQKTANQVATEYGVPIINKRVAISPAAELLGRATKQQAIELAKTLDKAAQSLNVDFIGGFSALVHKGISNGDQVLLDALPEALSQTERVCASISVATTRTGINMDAVAQLGTIIHQTAVLTKDNNSIGCAKLVVFCNPVEDNPFMAGAFHGAGGRRSCSECRCQWTWCCS